LCPTDVHKDGLARAQAHVSVHLCDGSAGCREKQQPIARLLSNSQSINDCPVPGIIDVPEIIQQSATTPDKLQQTTSGVMVFLMEFEMLRQIGDPVRQHGNLDFRGAGIAVMLSKPLYQLRFRFL
jgi:hypothetical protein